MGDDGPKVNGGVNQDNFLRLMQEFGLIHKTEHPSKDAADEAHEGVEGECHGCTTITTVVKKLDAVKAARDPELRMCF